MNGTGSFPLRPVRPYVLTGGRSAPTRNTIRPETVVVSAPDAKPLPVSASRTERALLGMCRRLLSLAEAAAHLELPVSAVLVVASDLVDSGHLTVRTLPGALVNDDLLQELLSGLRKLG
jgi:hypothetical protein